MKTKTKQTTRTGTEPQNGDHMEGYQQGSGRRREGEKVQRISSINGKYIIDGRRFRIVWEMENSENLYVPPIDLN